MKKYFLIFILLGLWNQVSANLSIGDSLRIVKLEEQVKTLTNNNESFKQKIEGLEKDRDRLSNIGITAGGLTLLGLGYMAFLYMWGIKKKAEATVNEIAPNKLKELVPDIVKNQMNAHALIKEYNDTLELKKKPILILSAVDKYKPFHDFLVDKGFENLNSKKIDDIEDIPANDFDLVLFNNDKGDLTQKQMDIVITKYKDSFDYFYFNTTRQRFDAEGITISFANSKETLENRLVEVLKK